MRKVSRLSSRQSKTFLERRRERSVYGGILAFVTIVLWIFILSKLTTVGVFSIDDVEVAGADPGIANTLRDAALSAMQGGYLGIFSRSSSFIYPKNDIDRRVLQASPEVGAVSVGLRGLNTLVVTVTPKKPAAVACLDLPDLTVDDSGDAGSDSCYLTDSSGFIFKAATAADVQAYDRFYFPDHIGLPEATTSAVDPNIGTYATSTVEFAKLMSFYSSLLDSGFKVQGVLVKEGGEYECYILGTTVQAGAASTSEATDQNGLVVVYFNDTQPLSAELDDFVSFWSHASEQARTDGTFPQFDYIDVRFGSNVFYRLAK